MLKRPWDAISSAEGDEERLTRTRHQAESGHSPPTIRLHTLCSVCKTVFSRVRENRRVFSWFHSEQELLTSASKGCHFCTHVANSREQLAETRPSNSPGGHRPSDNTLKKIYSTSALKAECNYISSHETGELGVHFALRDRDADEHDVIATVDLDLLHNASG